MIQSYKELTVWQKSIDLVQAVYELTCRFPKEEVYGLSSQMRRAAISISSNIAEGQRRKDLPEYLQFLRIADASSAELETQIIISKRLYPNLDYSLVESLLEEVQKMLNVLIRKLRTKGGDLKPKTYNLKPNSGFTLIELLVTSAFMVAIGAATLLYLGQYRNIKDLERSSDEILAVIQATQKRSITQEDGKRWGIRFVNPASGSDYYEVFKGSSYASGTVVAVHYFRRANVVFIDPPAEASKEIVFQPITGSVNSYFSITLGLTNDPTEQRVIEVTTSGKINLFKGGALVVSSIDPNSGVNTGSVSISSITGANFKAGATVKLTKSGQPDIIGSGFTVTSYATIAGGSFNILNATTGPWNVVVINPDNSSSSLANGFTIKLPAPTVGSINPSSGARNTTVSNITVTGTNFQSGATAKITKIGQPDIFGTGFVFSSSTQLSSGSFNLNGAQSGTWNVVVTNPDAQYGTLLDGFTVTSATGTIDSINRWAWSDNAGWFDFATTTSNVAVGDTAITGRAWNANYGWLYLDCNTLGSCGVQFGVTNTATGTLAGWAWNDNFGWVSFNCSNQGTCGTVDYKVTINSAGDFVGWAWSDNIGWISFNCANTNSCGTVNYKVKTTWTPQ
jgi:four helix bundle protein